MTNFLKSGLAGAILTSAFLTFQAPARAESAPASQPVYGRCEVKAEGARDNFGQCHLTGATDGKVPDGTQLVIEQVAVSCMGPFDRQILILGIGTSLKPDSEMFTQIVIPLTQREVTTTERLKRYEALFTTRLYAGAGTAIEPYLSMEPGYVPSPKAVCGVTFHGRLEPVR
jgi:hypothetical protein